MATSLVPKIGAVGTLAQLSTDANGNTVLKGADGKPLYSLLDPETPVLLIGGDHPYLQWYGTNGNNGMARMYQDRGIKPYLAINTDTDGSTRPGGNDMCSWGELLSLPVEIVGHGHRHYQDNSAPNTGIKVTYTGAAASATVQVTGGNVVGVTTGAVDDFSLAVSAYATIADMVAAINAIANWVCTAAGELYGTELSVNLLTGAPVNAKSTAAKIPCGGGISIKYTGTLYRNVCVTHDGTNLRVFGDGKHLGAVAVAQTLSQLVTALNTITGVVTALSGSTTADNYISGTESGTNLHKWSGPIWLKSIPTMLEAGLSHGYMQIINQRKCKETAALNGVTLTAHAQSGGSFYSDSAVGEYEIYRGDVTRSGSPGNSYRWTMGDVMPHICLTTGYTQAQCVAIIDALADSPGHVVNLLVHKVLPDGTSGYSLPTNNLVYYDQTEASLLAILNQAKTHIDAGKIVPMTMKEVRGFRGGKPAENLLFNPKFKNSGESLTSVSTTKAIPGWSFTSTSGVGAASISSGSLVMPITAGGTLMPLYQICDLPPGTYELSADVEIAGYTSGSGVFAYMGNYIGEMSGITPAATFLTEGYIKGSKRVSLMVTLPDYEPQKATIISVAEPFNLGTNTNIQINIDSIAPINNLNCAGATPSATRAHEAAAAINAAIKANASYAAEYHTCARAENGKLIIESPWLGSSYGKAVTVSTPTTSNAIATIFGSSSTSIGYPRTTGDGWNRHSVVVGFGVELANGATVTIRNPKLRRINVAV